MLPRIVGAILTGLIAVMATTPCPEVKAEPVDDGSLIRIRHNQPHPLTAFLLEIVDYPGNRFSHMQDDLFRPTTAAGEEGRIVVASLMPGTVPDYLKVTAAIYANGDTCGPADKVKLIIDARRQNLQLNRELISSIEKARDARKSAQEIAAELTERARSESPAFSGVMTHVAEELKRRSVDEVLGVLRIVEQTLAASKPAF